jgi:TonB family protein
MAKFVFIFLTFALFFKEVKAQNGSSAYYVKKSGQLTSAKDSADYILVISLPDTSIDKNLFIVKEYYPNGKIRMITGSNTGSFPLELQGSSVTFFENGHKKEFKSFEKGVVSGDVITYYPNGKLHDIQTMIPYKKQFLKQCNDSTGTVLAENGNGRWIKFINEDFQKGYIEGSVKDGLEEGQWRGKQNDTTSIVWEYTQGHKVSSKKFDKAGNEIVDKIFTAVEFAPEFPGGLEAFARFLSKNTRYPAVARENGTQGRVIISFVVETDGTLTELKIAGGIGDGCDEEALRVVGMSPPWTPGMQNGRPVRVAYSVPIAFTLMSANSAKISLN